MANTPSSNSNKEDWLKRNSAGWKTKEGHVRYTRKDSLSRENVLKQWYGGNQLGINEITAKRENTVDLGSVFPDLIKSLGLEKENVFSIVSSSWKEVVGEVLKSRIIPIAIKGKCLHIEAQDSATIYHLKTGMLQDKLVEKLKKLTNGKITSIQFLARGAVR
ncbi:MAG: DUF721 domain-containing protein [Lentisphaeria bacterium]|nr:DUF721 domain-containing protein [Lentisphaeria bacterium]